MALNLDALETSFDLMAPRGEELVTLVLLRESLGDLDAITPTLRELGHKHVGYGARPEHYPVVASVLIAAMAEVAGDAWTSEYERAWGEALSVVAGAMLSGTGSSPTATVAAGVLSPAAT
jgi:globin